MAEFTENYNLIKPAQEDYYDVTDFNENMDAIDTQMAETEQEIESLGEKIDGVDTKADGISTKIGDTSDTEANTLFGCLNSLICRSEEGETVGVRIIKSIQRVTFSIPKNSTSSSTISINAVDPSRCIVLMDRLFDSASSTTSLNYSFSDSTTLQLSHASLSSTTGTSASFGFWIVEFY